MAKRESGRVRYWLALLVVATMFWGPARANYEQGLSAFEAGEYAAAFVEWRASAAEGDNRAQFRLGQLYEQGLGVPQNFAQAHAWYSLAAARGNSHANHFRDTLSKRMTPEERSKAEAAAARLFAANPAGAATTAGGQATQSQGSGGTAGQGTTQAAALPDSDVSFDGSWGGYGSNRSNATRQKCGSGPNIQFTIEGKTARGKFVLTIPGRNQGSTEVVPLKGRVDDKGRFKLTGRDTEVAGKLAAGGGRADGEWRFDPRGCRGDFRLAAKS